MSARETFLEHARSILWAKWSTSSEELASAAVDTLMGLGMLVPEGGAAELERLRLLQNAQPAELSEVQVDALADAGNRALNDHYHEDLCLCSDWPESCVSSGNYFAGSWDTAAFSIGMAAVIGVWESMRAPAELDELARLRARVASLGSEIYDIRLRRDDARAGREDAEREAERLRARVAELEALKPDTIQTCSTCGAGYTLGEPCSVCQFQARMATELAVRPCGCPARFERHADGCPTTAAEDVTPQVQRLRDLLAEQRAAVEVPHEGPEPHAYRLGRDLPEVPSA